MCRSEYRTETQAANIWYYISYCLRCRRGCFGHSRSLCFGLLYFANQLPKTKKMKQPQSRSNHPNKEGKAAQQIIAAEGESVSLMVIARLYNNI